MSRRVKPQDRKKRTYWNHLTPEEQARRTRDALELAVACPGLNLDELGARCDLAQLPLRRILKSRNLSLFHQRIGALPYFHGKQGSAHEIQTIYGARPGAIGHVDTTVLAVYVTDGQVEKITTAVLMDNLTGFVNVGCISEENALSSFIREAHNRGFEYDTYVLDRRDETLGVEAQLASLKKHWIRTVMGTMWNNTRVERFHHFLRNFCAKQPRSYYAKPKKLFDQIQQGVLTWNLQAPSGMKGTRTHEFHNKRPRPKAEVMDIVTERNRIDIDLVPYKEDWDATEKPFAFVCTARTQYHGGEYEKNFAKRFGDGFYWAIGT